MRRITMLVNPVFSAWRRRSVPRIREVFEQAGIAVDYAETGPDRAASETVRRATESSTDAIVVCGGDGTVFDVLQGLAGSTIPIGICPFGTGNVLVQNLGLPRGPVAAARALLNAKPLTVPLGRVICGAGAKSWYFAMAAGVGAHAAMMKAAYRYNKHRTGRLAYFAAGVEALATHPLQPFEIELTTLDGSEIKRQASEMIAVRVAELNLWRPGGGFELPFLRVATVESASRAQLLNASIEALVLGAGRRDRTPGSGAAARYDDVLRIKVSPVAGLAYRAPLTLEADGESLAVVNDGAPATIEMAGVNATFLSARS